jgi:hypothetical protein
LGAAFAAAFLGAGLAAFLAGLAAFAAGFFFTFSAFLFFLPMTADVEGF